MSATAQLVLRVAAAACLGWLLGLLVSYLADILPGERRLERLRCRFCDAPQPWLSTFLLPGPCPHCRRSAPARTRLLGVGLALGAAWLAYRPLENLGFPLSLLVLAYFSLVVVIDIEHRLVLHITSLFGVFLGLAVGWQRLGIYQALVGGLAAVVILLTLFLLGIAFGAVLKRLRGRSIEETVFGFGDVILGGVIGLMLGWPQVVSGLVYAVLLAGGFSLVYLIYLLVAHRYRLGTAFPYAPFLILGALIVLF